VTNDSRPVDLLSDSKGVYGIGIAYDDVREEQSMCDRHLIFRPDVLAESALPNENREALFHTVPDNCFVLTHEWKLHEVMLEQALRRNPRYQELEKELVAEQTKGKEWWEGDRGNYIAKSDGDNTSGNS
jgi:hypothetical protein